MRDKEKVHQGGKNRLRRRGEKPCYKTKKKREAEGQRSKKAGGSRGQGGGQQTSRSIARDEEKNDPRTLEIRGRGARRRNK